MTTLTHSSRRLSLALSRSRLGLTQSIPSFLVPACWLGCWVSFISPLKARQPREPRGSLASPCNCLPNQGDHLLALPACLPAWWMVDPSQWDLSPRSKSQLVHTYTLCPTYPVGRKLPLCHFLSPVSPLFPRNYCHIFYLFRELIHSLVS